MLRCTLLLQARKNQAEGLETPLDPFGDRASVQPLAGASWQDSVMADGFGGMASPRKEILVAWSEPLVSWRKEIEVRKEGT